MRGGTAGITRVLQQRMEAAEEQRMLVVKSRFRSVGSCQERWGEAMVGSRCWLAFGA